MNESSPFNWNVYNEPKQADDGSSTTVFSGDGSLFLAMDAKRGHLSIGSGEDGTLTGSPLVLTTASGAGSDPGRPETSKSSRSRLNIKISLSRQPSEQGRTLFLDCVDISHTGSTAVIGVGVFSEGSPQASIYEAQIWQLRRDSMRPEPQFPVSPEHLRTTKLEKGAALVRAAISPDGEKWSLGIKELSGAASRIQIGWTYENAGGSLMLEDRVVCSGAGSSILDIIFNRTGSLYAVACVNSTSLPSTSTSSTSHGNLILLSLDSSNRDADNVSEAKLELPKELSASEAGKIGKLAFSVEGEELCFACGSLLHVWELVAVSSPSDQHQTHMQLDGRVTLLTRDQDANDSQVLACTFSSDDDYIAVAYTRAVIVIDTETLVPLRTIAVPATNCTNVVGRCLSFISNSLDLQVLSRLYHGNVSVGLGCWRILNASPHEVQMSTIPDGNEIDESDYTAPSDLTGLIINSWECVGSGGFGEVYKGEWKNARAFIVKPKELAIKIMRRVPLRNTGMEPIERRLEREIALWKMLRHENILPYIGKSLGFGSTHSIISEWMPNGTPVEFCDAHSDANRMEIVLGTARGLEHLHSHNPSIIHGDMKASNVLIDRSGQPRIMDFGMSRVIDAQSFWITTRSSVGGSLRWMCPELLDLQNACPQVTTSSDVYAFAMTCLEIFTGQVPFQSKYSHDGQVLHAVMLYDERPERPDVADVTDSLWQLWQKCWLKNWQLRPTTSDLVESLREMAGEYRPLRILSIDSNPFHMTALFPYLQAILSLLPPNSKLSDHFDLICGSGVGGFIALLIGRLNMSVSEIQAEFHLLCDTFWEQLLKSKRLAGGDVISFPAAKIEKVIHRLILRYKYDPKEPVDSSDLTKCRIVASVSSGRNKEMLCRTYAGDSHVNTRLTLQAALVGALQSGWDLSHFRGDTNPSHLALSEAMEIFGAHRSINLFLSCGVGNISGHNQPASPKRLGTQGVHDDMTRQLGMEYVRFDIKSRIEKKLAEAGDPDWESMLSGREWRVFAAVKEIASEYMEQPEQKKKAAFCAERMQWRAGTKNKRGRGRGSTVRPS